MDDLRNYLNELINLRKELKLNYDDNALLDVGCRIFISQNIQRDKGNYNSKKEINTEPRNDPATQKQIKFLIALGYKGDVSKLTKFDAKKLIEQGLGK